MVRNLLGPMAEQFFYVENIASSVLVGENNWFHQLLLEACQTLELSHRSCMYVSTRFPMLIRLLYGANNRLLSCTLPELLTPEEIQAVIAHELGHLKCDHGVYLTLVNLLVLAAGQLPNLGGLIAQTLQAQL